jgi:hypothetical protein
MIASKCLASFTSDLETRKKHLTCIYRNSKKRRTMPSIEGRIEKIDHLASDKSRLIEEADKTSMIIVMNTLQKQGLSTGAKDSINAWLAEQHSGQSER